MTRPRDATLLLSCLLAGATLVACKSKQAQSDTSAAAQASPAPDSAAASATSDDAATTEAQSAEIEQLLAWLTPEPLAVAYDRTTTRLDPHSIETVFAIPRKAADLLDERAILDEGLDIVFDGDAEASNWLGPTSLAFTVALSKTPYFVRPLTKPAAEVGPLLVQGGFSSNTIDGIEIWLPDGSFPWRIALLEGEVAAFIPVDVPGAGLEPFNKARETEPSAVETELSRNLSEDGMIELVLVAAGPRIHFDVGQAINQVQFALRKIPGSKPGYEGLIQLTPSGDPDEAVNSLRGRSHPEENQQIQALIASVEFQVVAGAVGGRLEITPDQLKHFLDR